MPGTKHLTDALCRKQKPPDKGMAITWDDDCKGFGYRITAAKARSFVLNYRTAGRQRQMTIGSFPDWGVTRARVKAREYKRDIDSGGDPLAERDQLRSAPTVSDLVERYRKDSLPRKRPSTQKTQTSYLQKHILPALGSRKVASITHTDMDVLHRRIKAPILANRCVSFCSAMFNLAVRLDWIERNPCKGVERNPEQPRHRYLSGDEISRLMAALDRHPGQGANAIRFLLLTGARRMEVLGATWSQFDLVEGIWTKPHTSTKQARMHRVPLSEAVLTILRDMRSVVDQRVASAKAEQVRIKSISTRFGASSARTLASRAAECMT